MENMGLEDSVAMSAPMQDAFQLKRERKSPLLWKILNEQKNGMKKYHFLI